MIKNIGVLTSGGDAPGMNATVRSIVRCGISKGFNMHAIYNGFNGLLDGSIEPVSRRDVCDILQRGGTVLCTARCKEFINPEGQQKGYEIAKEHGLDAIVVVGGDGSFKGARALANLGLPTVIHPAVREIGDDYKEIGDVLPVKSLVGVVYDKDCDDYQRAYTRAYQIDKDIYVQSIGGAFGAMLDNNIHADIITFDEISDYKAIILTNHIALGKDDAEKLMQYVENGGTLIIDGKFGMVDREAMLQKDLPGGYFNAQVGLDLLDSDYVDMDFEYEGQKVKGYYFKYICDVLSGEVSAKFSDGRCAV